MKDAGACVKPEDLKIVKRSISFKIEQFDRYWHGDDICKTHFFNALSTIFPVGEGQFVKSVLAVRNQISDPKLINDIDCFISQEGAHSREHRRFNDHLKRQGYDIDSMELNMKCKIKKRSQKMSPEMNLAVTMAMEHYTAIFAHEILSKQSIFEGAAPNVRSLWLWHAVEETEHKSVVFDTFNHLGGKYSQRVKGMLIASLVLFTDVFGRMALMIKKDGVRLTIGQRLRWWRFHWGKNGFFRDVIKDYFNYFRISFHPWCIDNRTLTSSWVNRYSADPMSILYL